MSAAVAEAVPLATEADLTLTPDLAADKQEAVVAEAEAAGLTYVSDTEPGIRRRRAGKGFSYRDADGKAIKDPATLARIKALAIPPAYHEVWICPDPNGHIQATGRDEKGRKQYRYHTRWREYRDGHKYGRMAAFGRALPRLRERVEVDLRKQGLNRDKVLATVVRLLERTLIRVGNDEYAKTNKSFGLTTLRKRHIDVSGTDVGFKFRGKSGVLHETHLRDRRLANIVRQVQDLPGQRLFKYVDAEGQLQNVESADVNAYLREALGGDFTAKDFRTWAGTVAAARALLTEPVPESQTAAKKALTRCVQGVSRRLGNTPAVCRSSYIHPKVMESFSAGALGEAFKDAETDEAFEAACLVFLDAEASLERDKAGEAEVRPA
jgi:DNA topoisomerase-1